MRYKEPYSYYKRKTKSGKNVFYYRIWNKESRRTTGTSTGCTTLSSFRNYTVELIRKEEFFSKKDLRFEDFDYPDEIRKIIYTTMQLNR